MTRDLKTALRELVLDLLADAEPAAGSSDLIPTWVIDHHHLDQLCALADLGEVDEALEEIRQQRMAGERGGAWG